MTPEQRERQREYRAANREALNARRRERYATDPEHREALRAAARKARQERGAEINARRRASWQRRKDRVNAERRERYAEDREHRERILADYAEKRAGWWEENEALVLEAKGTRCHDCGGEFEPEKLHLHHIDPETRLFYPGGQACKNWWHPPEVLVAELAKCVPLCRSCNHHRHRAEREAGRDSIGEDFRARRRQRYRDDPEHRERVRQQQREDHVRHREERLAAMRRRWAERREAERDTPGGDSSPGGDERTAVAA